MIDRDPNPSPYLSHAYMAFEVERRHPGALAKLIWLSVILAFVIFGCVAPHL